MSESIGSNTLTSTEKFEIDPGYDISSSFEQQIKRYNLHTDEFPEEKIPEDIEKLKTLRSEIKQMYNDGSIRDITIKELANKEYDKSNASYAAMEYFHNMMNEYETTIEKMKDLRERHFKAQLPENDETHATYDVYNGCHGELISTPISKRIPKSIQSYLERNKNSQVELHFHKNTPLFTEVLPSSFTKGEHEDFKSPPFHNYLKFTFGYEFSRHYGGGEKRKREKVDSDVEPEIVMRIFISDKKNNYVELDAIPDIEFSYEDNDKFDMGTFNIITDDGAGVNPEMYPLELIVTPFSEEEVDAAEDNRILFPKIKHHWKYLKDRGDGIRGNEVKTMNHDDGSLLDHLFENLPDIALKEHRFLKVNIFNSSCMASDNFYDLITKYPRWYRHLKEEIDNAFFIRVSEQNYIKFRVSKEINEKEEKIEDKHEQREKLLKQESFLKNKKRALESAKDKELKKTTSSLDKLNGIDKSLSIINFKIIDNKEHLHANAILQEKLIEEKEKLGNRLLEIDALLESFEQQKNNINKWLEENDNSDSVMRIDTIPQLKQQKLMSQKNKKSKLKGGKSLTASRRTSRRSTSRRRTSRRRTSRRRTSSRRTSTSRRRTLRGRASRRRTSRRSTG